MSMRARRKRVSFHLLLSSAQALTSYLADDTTELYTTFWSLQRTFTNPPALFSSSPASTSSTPAPATDSFAALHTALEKTLIVFSAATKKEKELGGASKNSASAGKQKAKLSSEEEDESLEHYFFPKFLTSKNLLELEVRFEVVR